MTDIKFNVDLAGDLEKILQRKELAMREVVADIKAKILVNTGQGIDFEGKPFEAYNKPYAAKKAKSGRSTKPNLNVTGQMLRDVQTQVSYRNDVIEGRVFIQDGRSTAPSLFGGKTTSSVKKAKEVQKKRRFIGVTEADKERHLKKIRDA